MNSKWNNKTVKNEALKYSRRIDFKNGSRGAYTYACKNNLMDIICKHMKSGYINRIVNKKILDFESCKIEATKYSRRIDFRDNSSGAYKHALKHGFMNEICKHMIQTKSRKKTLTKRDIKINKLLKIASKYSELKDFRENEINVYQSCKNLGIFDEATKHMFKHKHLNGNYTFEECLNNALKSRSRFKNDFYNQYKFCESKCWIDQIQIIINLYKLIEKNNETINSLENEIKDYNEKIGFCCKNLQILKDINLNSLNTIDNIKNFNI